MLFNKLKDRLRHKKWHLHYGTHLVFKHEHVTYVSMQLLLIWAYVSYYVRGWRAIRGFVKAFVKNTPLLKVFWGKAI